MSGRHPSSQTIGSAVARPLASAPRIAHLARCAYERSCWHRLPLDLSEIGNATGTLGLRSAAWAACATARVRRRNSPCRRPAFDPSVCVILTDQQPVVGLKRAQPAGSDGASYRLVLAASHRRDLVYGQVYGHAVGDRQKALAAIEVVDCVGLAGMGTGAFVPERISTSHMPSWDRFAQADWSSSMCSPIRTPRVMLFPSHARRRRAGATLSATEWIA
jgi:hypothetical protein